MIANITTTQSDEFLRWLSSWNDSLTEATIDDPSETAVLVVDMVNGFCKTGNLASERVGNLIPPVADLLRNAQKAGVTRFLIAEDTHRADDREFSAFPPHCIAGSGEEKTVDEIASLPFEESFEYVSKPSVNLCVNTDVPQRLMKMLDEGVYAFIIVGDCTDLCVYQSASQVRMTANALDREARVVIPANAVDTYDIPIETAQQLGALPHPGELMHQLFLYHMALIGCEVVSSVSWGERA